MTSFHWPNIMVLPSATACVPWYAARSGAIGSERAIDVPMTASPRWASAPASQSEASGSKMSRYARTRGWPRSPGTGSAPVGSSPNAICRCMNAHALGVIRPSSRSTLPRTSGQSPAPMPAMTPAPPPAPPLGSAAAEVETPTAGASTASPTVPRRPVIANMSRTPSRCRLLDDNPAGTPRRPRLLAR